MARRKNAKQCRALSVLTVSFSLKSALIAQFSVPKPAIKLAESVAPHNIPCYSTVCHFTKFCRRFFSCAWYVKMSGRFCKEFQCSQLLCLCLSKAILHSFKNNLFLKDLCGYFSFLFFLYIPTPCLFNSEMLHNKSFPVLIFVTCSYANSCLPISVAAQMYTSKQNQQVSTMLLCTSYPFK